MSGLEFTKAELAAAFGVTTRSIELYQTDPDFPSPRREGRKNLYPLADCIAWFIDYRIAQRVGESDIGEQLDLQQERARLAKAQRVRQEFQHQVDQGRFASTEDMGMEWAKFVSNCRARLLGMPSKTAPLVAIESSIPACAELIRREVYEALTELSETGADEVPN